MSRARRWSALHHRSLSRRGRPDERVVGRVVARDADREQEPRVAPCRGSQERPSGPKIGGSSMKQAWSTRREPPTSLDWSAAVTVGGSTVAMKNARIAGPGYSFSRVAMASSKAAAKTVVSTLNSASPPSSACFSGTPTRRGGQAFRRGGVTSSRRRPRRGVRPLCTSFRSSAPTGCRLRPACRRGKRRTHPASGSFVASPSITVLWLLQIKARIRIGPARRSPDRCPCEGVPPGSV